MSWGVVFLVCRSLLPVGLPLDDVARRAFMRGAEEALEAGGDAGLRAYVKDQIGDEAGDTVLNQMDECQHRLIMSTTAARSALAGAGVPTVPHVRSG